MGGVFGICSNNECVTDLFFGTDYHSHLGTRWGGMAVFDGKQYTRVIHNIENAPFRTKFESDIPEMKGFMGIGCISDSNLQPIIINSRIGTFAVVTVGRINNKDELARQLTSENNVYFFEISGGSINDTELVASLICRKDNIPDGIKYAQRKIEGSMTMLISADGGLYAARDRLGRTPLFVGEKDNGEDGYCASFESFSYINLGYKTCHELGPGEIVFITPDKMTSVSGPLDKMKMCTFLWLYYGFPTSDYEGVNVEEMRYKCGQSMATQDIADGTGVKADYIAGIPDSGTPHAIGYANQSKIPFARPLIKYTPTWPRSFTPKDQSIRNLIARMKLIPISALIKNKKLLFVEDSIVRGTQLRGMMDELFSYGAKELHGRIACPPILYDCKYLNFTRSLIENEAITRKSIIKLEVADSIGDSRLAPYADPESKQYRNMVEDIRKELNFTTLKYHSLHSMLRSVGIDKCRLCTYCWNGKE
ncbi:MAG: amidophosphoribosyltransferase [Eubacteriales bacterium]|nr:amidophosphoribosyltransferase [Eubacteriales bacterium]